MDCYEESKIGRRLIVFNFSSDSRRFIIDKVFSMKIIVILVSYFID